jgi:hypothetical protein
MSQGSGSSLVMCNKGQFPKIEMRNKRFKMKLRTLPFCGKKLGEPSKVWHLGALACHFDAPELMELERVFYSIKSFGHTLVRSCFLARVFQRLQQNRAGASCAAGQHYPDRPWPKSNPLHLRPAFRVADGPWFHCPQASWGPLPAR